MTGCGSAASKPVSDFNLEVNRTIHTDSVWYIMKQNDHDTVKLYMHSNDWDKDPTYCIAFNVYDTADELEKYSTRKSPRWISILER